MVDRFAAASGDFNPLHVSDSYARTTPFGKRVVHGVCALLGCCGFFRPPSGHYPAALRVVFHQPLFPDLDYELRVSWPSVQQAVAHLIDGSTQLMEVTFDFRSGAAPVADLPRAGTGATLCDADRKSVV